jgi:hypothetical protein
MANKRTMPFFYDTTWLLEPATRNSLSKLAVGSITASTAIAAGTVTRPTTNWSLSRT